MKDLGAIAWYPRVFFEGGGAICTLINCGGAVWEVYSPSKLSAWELELIQRSCTRAQECDGVRPGATLSVDRLNAR